MIRINANAKINLTLDVLGKRSDGYHEVSMIMQSVNLSDTLILRKINDTSKKIVFLGDVKGVDKPEDNLAYKAADLFLRTYNINDSIEITLKKNIPVAAGLAGGSSDAGAVLRGLNSLFNLNLPNETLCEIGSKLGSDIPFCIIGGTMLAEGRGEKLSPIPPMPPTDLILVKPKIDVSTAWVYKNYDKIQTVIHPDNKKMQIALENKDLKSICQNLRNVLENVTISAYPEIEKIKHFMCKSGALAAMMSGSGPTVFAIVENTNIAADIAEKLKSKFDAAVFITKTTGAN